MNAVQVIDEVLGELQHELDLILLNVERGRVPPINALTALLKAELEGKAMIERVQATAWPTRTKARVLKRVRKMLADARVEAEHFVKMAEPGGGVGQA